MAKRMRRATVAIGGAVAGARNVSVGDDSEWNSDRGDDETGGVFVRMSTGPYPVTFELLARDGNVETGYVATMTIVGKEISVAAGVETSTDRTWTLTDGYLKVSADLQTDDAGRIPVEGSFRTLVET